MYGSRCQSLADRPPCKDKPLSRSALVAERPPSRPPPYAPTPAPRTSSVTGPFLTSSISIKQYALTLFCSEGTMSGQALSRDSYQRGVSLAQQVSFRNTELSLCRTLRWWVHMIHVPIQGCRSHLCKLRSARATSRRAGAALCTGVTLFFLALKCLNSKKMAALSDSSLSGVWT